MQMYFTRILIQVCIQGHKDLQKTEVYMNNYFITSGFSIDPTSLVLVINELTKDIQDEVPWCISFADDIVLVDENKEESHRIVKLSRDTLELKIF